MAYRSLVGVPISTAILAAFGCVTPAPSPNRQPAPVPRRVIDPTLLLKVGNTVVPATGKYFYDVEGEGRTVFYSGDTVAWVAVVGNAYTGHDVEVVIVDVTSGESFPVFSTQREAADSSFMPVPAESDFSVYPGQFVLRKQEQEARKILRLRVGGSAVDRPLVFSP